jgi:cyclic pyranopterin phosphate synthase
MLYFRVMSSSHLNETGQASMVDVGEKHATRRVAVASGKVILPDEVLKCVRGSDIFTPKGAVFQIARIAGVHAAKQTGQLIPLCHPLPLEYCNVEIELTENVVTITAEARITSKTGVEMEALQAVSSAALTIYDMCKSIGQGISITDIRLIKKTGGKNDYHASK